MVYVNLKILYFICFFCVFAFAKADSTLSVNAKKDTLSVLDVAQSNAVKIIKWPLEYIIQPSFDLLLIPVKPPLEYIYKEKVVERGVDLFTFGKDKNVFLYPTIKLLSGRGDHIGLSYIHFGIFYPDKDRLKGHANIRIDHDWVARFSYSKKDFFVKSWKAQLDYNIWQEKDDSFYSSHNKHNWVQRDSSFSYSFKLSRALTSKSGVSAEVSPRHIRHSLEEGFRENLPIEEVSAYELDSAKGFGQEDFQLPMTLAYAWNTKRSPYAATDGFSWSSDYSYAYLKKFGNYNRISSQFSFYKLLGNKKYKLSHSEDKKAQRFLKNLSIGDIGDMIVPENFTKVFLQRKVLLNYFRFAQSWKGEEQDIHIYGRNSLGNGSPLRAYSGSSIISRGHLLWSAEYRWPLIRRVDGTFFNEYGVSFERPWRTDTYKLYNSWGFGFRIRTPTFFLARAQMAFHGLEGASIILTISSAYE